MGSGISVRNNTGIDVLVTLSQVGPLHWKIIPPWTTKKIGCGRVWFNVDARLIDNNGKPGRWSVAMPFVIGIGGGITFVTSAGAAVAVATSIGWSSLFSAAFIRAATVCVGTVISEGAGLTLC